MGGFFIGLKFFSAHVSDISHIVTRLDILHANNNALWRNFSPTWRSLKRVVDLPYVLYYAFYTTKLPVYELSLSRSDTKNLLANLPVYPGNTLLYDEHKEAVKGSFRTSAYFTDEAKIRYRGLTSSHWNAKKKSWHIILPSSQPLQGTHKLRFVLPEDRRWATYLVNQHRAQKLNLIMLTAHFGRLTVNEENAGIYLVQEGWTPALLTKTGRTPDGIIFSERDGALQKNLFMPEHIDMWENKLTGEPAASHKALRALLDLIANSPDDEFANTLPRILNMEATYNWMLLIALSGSAHQNNYENAAFYFDPSSNMFEPIPFDLSLNPLGSTWNHGKNNLIRRIMSIPSFQKEFSARIAAYVRNPQTLQDDLAVYDMTVDQIKPDVLSDIKKIQSSAEVLQSFIDQRTIIETNAHILADMIRQNGAIYYDPIPKL